MGWGGKGKSSKFVTDNSFIAAVARGPIVYSLRRFSCNISGQEQTFALGTRFVSLESIWPLFENRPQKIASTPTANSSTRIPKGKGRYFVL